MLKSRGRVTLSAQVRARQGIIRGALKGDRSLSLRDSNPTGKFFPLLDGRNIGKYTIKWNGVYLDYDVNKIHSCKRQDIFLTNHKLLFRRVSENLMFAYDDQQFFALNTLVVVNLKKEDVDLLKYLLALLNSSLLNYLYKKRFKSTKKVFSEIQARTVMQLPIAIPSDIALDTLPKLVSALIQTKSLKTKLLEPISQYLEDLIDACVMECYFREHMLERDLLFLDEINPYISTYNPDASEAERHGFLDHLHHNLNAPDSIIRSKLLRISTDSPDMLAVIKEEGRV